MNNILIITNSFPYLPGEQFLETEIPYWTKLSAARIEIMPQFAPGQPRTVPADIKVHPMTHCTLRRKDLFYTVFEKIFWKEVLVAWRERVLKLATVRYIMRSVVITSEIKKIISDHIRREGKICLGYSYWNHEAAYALCMLKREGLVKKVISRAHGYDLYESRSATNYLPLKRQFIEDFDYVFAVSENGMKYLQHHYGFPKGKLKLSRLGVSLPNHTSKSSCDGVVRIVSVSSCVVVKRIDKIIRAIVYSCNTYPNLKISWVHIGDGPLKPRLEALSEKLLSHHTSVQYQFKGSLENKAVYDFYQNNLVDVFINCSESEGLPVSIMEAMAHGIPCIAPDVGGICELVDEKNGYLISSSVTPSEILTGIIKLTGPTAAEYRKVARKKVIESFAEQKNYNEFISSLQAMLPDDPDLR